MSNVSYTEEIRETAHSSSYPSFGIVPKSSLGRLFFGWGLLNIVLTLLPVFGIYGNGSAPGPLGMPLTVVYSYAVFSLNCLLGLAYFLTRGRVWVDMEAQRTQEGKA